MECSPGPDPQNPPPEVRLEPVVDENRAAVGAIEVTEEQRPFINNGNPVSGFVADVPDHPTFTPYAISAGSQVVGLISYGHEDWDDTRWWIPLIVIDYRQQHRGYGRAAPQMAIERMKVERPERWELGLRYLPENVAAERLYLSLGFVKSPKLDAHGSVEAWLRLCA